MTAIVTTVHKAHGMMLHRLQVGRPVNFAHGVWQLSRVYAMSVEDDEDRRILLDDLETVRKGRGPC